MAQSNQTNEAKRIPAIEVEVIRENGLAHGLNLTFANGKKLQLKHGDLTNILMAEGLWHGLKQKLVDAAAISRNAETGRSATVEDKYNAVFAVYQRLLAGEWNAAREGGGQLGLLLTAMVEFTGKPANIVKTWLDGKSDAEKKALGLNPKIAAIINRIRAERAKAEGIDSDELLNEAME